MNSYTIQYGDTLSGIASKTGKSMQELMRLNPSITDPNKIYAGRTLSLGASPAPAPAPAPTPAAKQTIAQVAKVTVPTFVEDSGRAQIGKDLKSQATQQANDEAIRAATRARIQGQIDAINAAVQDQIINFRNTTGKNRQGQSYALAAAGGRIGSPTGEAEFQKVEDYNNQEEQTYRSEANLKISALYGQANRDADAEIKTKREAIQQGIDKYFEFLDNQGQRKREQVSAFVKNMLALGVDPTSLSDADFEKLQDQYGFSKEQLSTLYNDAKAERDQSTLKTEKEKVDLDKAKNDANQFSLNEGDARYVYDPETGTAKLIASRAKTYAPKGADGPDTPGTSLGYDDPNYTLDSIRKSKGGRFLTQGELKPITDIQTVVGQAETLSGLINSVDTGPIVGIVKSANPYDTKAQLMKSAITAIVPKLARGVYGEVGVLTDADIENYSRTIANLKNTADVNKAVMAMTLDIATRSLANQLNSLSAGGRDVSRFEAIYTGMNTKAASIKSELGTGQPQTSQPSPFTSKSGKTYNLPN
ncbi:MAG: LysM peptidoglycan-binding domain-containing protein [Candidatus Pacebacteria bacterium]|nr:LysM peptidoglycan-binding domain-containing protein [Candidatus Paceibacterota bacterium]